MKNIDKIEFEWHNIECLDMKIINSLLDSCCDSCLIKTNRGVVKVVEVDQSDRFLRTHGQPWDEYYFDSKEDINGECFDEVKEFAKHEEFILYSTEVWENSGNYNGRGITIYDDAVEIALLPNSPIVDALINFMY
jgi:hypothetical protein